MGCGGSIVGAVVRRPSSGRLAVLGRRPGAVLGGGVAFAGFIEGMSATALGGGNGFGWSGRYNPELAGALHRSAMRRTKISGLRRNLEIAIRNSEPAIGR